MTKLFSYRKEEKLKSRKLLDELFAAGNTVAAFPIKIFYMKMAEGPFDFPLKVGVGVSSRYFKHATDRNRIKRLLRESYRLNKLILHDFVKDSNKQLVIFFLYTGKELPEYSLVTEKMKLVIGKLIENIERNNKKSEG